MIKFKLHSKIFFQDVHIFNIFKKQKILNLTENKLKTSNLLHSNNGVLKIFSFFKPLLFLSYFVLMKKI